MVEQTRTRKSKLVKITLQTLVAGPSGIAKPGTVLTLPEDEASEYVQNRFAREYDPKKDRKAKHGWTVAEVAK